MTYSPSEFSVGPDYLMAAGDNSAAYLGAGRSGAINWDKGLTQTDVDALTAIIGYSAQNDDLPILVVPHYLWTDEAVLCTIGERRMRPVDIHFLDPDSRANRLYSLSAELVPVYA